MPSVIMLSVVAPNMRPYSQHFVFILTYELAQ
jgi:hypothetical protein